DGHSAGTHWPAARHRLRRALPRIGGVVLHDGSRDDRRRRLHGPITPTRTLEALMLTRMLRTACLTLCAVTLGTAPALAQQQTVVVSTATENEQIAHYMKPLKKPLPTLDVKMPRLSTGDISARFMAEKDNMQADAIWGVGATNMLIFKNAGLLEPYAPKGLDKIQGLFRAKAN